MKAFAYLRVSSQGQIDGDGFRRQEDEIRRFAESSDIKIVDVYREEGVSGTTEETDRPAFQEMITAVLKNGVKTIIVEDLTRLARQYAIQESLLIYLASKSIQLISARTGENVTEAIQGDPMKRALIQIQGVFAELEKGLLVKKLRTAREKIRTEQGKCEGRKGIKELDPDLLREIKRLRRKKNGKPTMTYMQVAEYLNQSGHRTVSGKSFTASNIQNICKRY